ncbi:hypothetical protein B0H10DRAFT_2319858 [Mycena sp. CBHHK59/15]|nr:hypothetical protein B0H10DRAFT_2319858 [Mycena sp. CBHHK59/15]
MPKRQDLDPGNPIKLAVKGEEHSVTTAGGGSLLVAPIIFPPGSNSPDHCDKKPIRGADLGLFQNHLPAGGCLVTIHDPLTASAWINLNYDHPLLRSLRDRQIGGPFAMMLSAHTEALVIFGPTDDPAILEYAKSLAKLSSFAIIVRRDADNPVSRFALAKSIKASTGPNVTSFTQDAGNGGQNFATSGSSTNAGTGESCENEDGIEDDRDSEDIRDNGDDDKGDSRRNGRGNGKGKSPITGNRKGGREKWEGLTHRVLAVCRLNVDADNCYELGIESTFRFWVPTAPEGPLDRDAMFKSLEQTDIEAFTRLEVGADGAQLAVDAAMRHWDSISGGNEPARQIYTQTSHEHTQTRSMERSKGQSSEIEAAADRAAPDWIVRQQSGDRFHEEQRSYISIATSYEPQLSPFGDITKPLDVNVGLGLILMDQDNSDQANISFVNRNQLHLWVSESDSKARARGVIVLVSNYLPNIRTESKLLVAEDELDVDITSPVFESDNAPRSSESSSSTLNPQQKSRIEISGPNGVNDALPPSDEVIEVSAARILKAPSTNTGKLRKAPPSPLQPLPSIPLRPLVTRGWDTSTQRWLTPVWPDLDEGFKAADAFRSDAKPKRCWKLERSRL